MAYNPCDIVFARCEWKEIHPHVQAYVQERHMTVESFWEDHVMESHHYAMRVEDGLAGYFSIHKGETIMLFHVFARFANLAQALFARVKRYESVTNAMVATGDEFFLSHCVDDFARIEKQAYFAVYTEKEIAQGRAKPIALRQANIESEEDRQLLALSNGFLDGEVENIRSGLRELKIYIAEMEGQVVGFGVIQYGRVVPGIASIGMYTREAFRQQGIGSSILQGLKHIVQEKGCRAFSGCWYYNHNSKKSMERAGAYAQTRLLRFYF